MNTRIECKSIAEDFSQSSGESFYGFPNTPKPKCDKDFAQSSGESFYGFTNSSQPVSDKDYSQSSGISFYGFTNSGQPIHELKERQEFRPKRRRKKTMIFTPVR